MVVVDGRLWGAVSVNSRNELPPDTDLELSMDLLAGPVYWRLSVMQLPVDDDYCNRLADDILAAVTTRSSA